MRIMNELQNFGKRPKTRERPVHVPKFTTVNAHKSLIRNVATVRCIYQYGLALSLRQRVRVGTRGCHQHLQLGKKNTTGFGPLKRSSRVKDSGPPNSWQNGRDVVSRNPTGGDGGYNRESIMWRLWIVLVGQSRQLQALDKVKEFSYNLVRLVARQCEVHTSERIRRGLQMYSLYSRLWGEEVVCCMLRNLRRSLFARGRNLVLSAVCFTGFDWQRDGISDEEMRSYENDVNQVERLCAATVQCETCGKRQVIDQLMPYVDYCSCGGKTGYCGESRYYDSWEPFIERDHVLVWRKRHHIHNHLYAYKVYGSYDDVCVTAFAEVQLNTQYRTVWDSSALDLRVIDAHPESNSDLVYWLVKFPHFFANRDYVFKRRYTVNHENKSVVILNKVTDYNNLPEVKGVHRVQEYWSVMVIKAREDFDKPGIEYTLTYFDNPGTSLPQRVTNFIASTGMPDFLRKVHTAALSLQDQAKEGQEVYHHIPEVLRWRLPAILPITDEEDLIKESVESIITSDLVKNELTIGSTVISEISSNSVVGENETSSSSVVSETDTFSSSVVSETETSNISVVSETPVCSDVSETHISYSIVSKTSVSPGSKDDSAEQTVVSSDAEGKTSMTESITDVDDTYSLTPEKQSPESLVDLVEIVDSEISPTIGDVGSETKPETVENKEEEIKDRKELYYSDLAVKVPGKGKEVIVNILEAMEVVSPELEKTVIAQKIEELKAKALLFKEKAILKKQRSLESMAALQRKRRNHYELSQFDEKTNGILETLFQAMREVLEADSIDRSKVTSFLKRTSLTCSAEPDDDEASEHKNVGSKTKGKTESEKNEKKEDPPDKGPPPGGAGDFVNNGDSVEVLMAGDTAAVHDQSLFQSYSDNPSSFQSSSDHSELRHYDKREDKRKEDGVPENEYIVDENMDSNWQWFISWITVPYTALVRPSSSHDLKYSNENDTNVPSEERQLESESGMKSWYSSWMSWNVFSKKNEDSCVVTSSPSSDLQENITEKHGEPGAKSWTAYLSSWIAWPFVSKESLCQGEVELVIQPLSSLPAEGEQKKEVEVHEMESKLLEEEAQETETNWCLREVKEIEFEWQEGEVRKTESQLSDCHQHAEQEGACGQHMEKANVLVEIEGVSYSSLSKDEVWFLRPADVMIKVYMWLLDTYPKYHL
ncbi:uncharacterized protein LOC143018551 [Oratosquilla oratoria]|uniref:uncharacterized protein LOC143018551 n=1 Tax=Oratosquilla oratoria TaxID=337810 RepID=UPI003F77476F